MSVNPADKFAVLFDTSSLSTNAKQKLVKDTFSDVTPRDEKGFVVLPGITSRKKLMTKIVSYLESDAGKPYLPDLGCADSHASSGEL